VDYSPEQERALAAIKRWSESSEQVFYLAGPAGSGKSTLANDAVQNLFASVLFCAYTGKAALVMRKKGCANATTFHKLVYVSKPRSQEEVLNFQRQIRQAKQDLKLTDEQVPFHPITKPIWKSLELALEKSKQPRFILNEDSPIKDADCVVVDECSMISDRAAEDIRKFNKKILVLGDPYQLPPVKGEGAFTSKKPDFLLTEIHRQARDNPIIDMATRIRNGEHLPFGKYGDSAVVRVNDLSPEEWASADQIICARNKTRVAINKRIRALRGATTAYPDVNDRIMIYRNNHELGILNGQVWKCLGSGDVVNGEISLTLSDYDDPTETVTANFYADAFNTERPSEVAPWEVDGAELADYGYCVTGHKVQGSQYDKVVVFDQSQMTNSPRQWLYTVATRAAQQLIIVRQP